jgi:hypothetical protein
MSASHACRDHWHVLAPPTFETIVCWGVRAEYSSIKHPASSSTLGSFSQLGIAAGGNGNHCDYLVGEIRESDDSPVEIKAHYSRFSFPMLDPQNSQWSAGMSYTYWTAAMNLTEIGGATKVT